MVWWITKYKPNPSICRSGSLCHYQSRDAEGDVVFPSTNIMFTFNHRKYGINDINYLFRSGVNIFNIDRTEHGQYFQDVQSALVLEARKQLQYSKYYIPVTLAITFSINEPIKIENAMDLIILKDVNNLGEYLEFKQQHVELLSKPILLWLNGMDVGDVEQLIRFSGGVVLERKHVLYSEGYCECILKYCKKLFKPIFYNHSKLVKEYYGSKDRDRTLIEVLHKLVENNADGISIMDDRAVELPPKEAVLSIVRAMVFAERNYDKEKDYLKLSFKLKEPVLPNITTALGACCAAFKCDAKAIIVLTKTGTSARWCALISPKCSIVAITREKSTARYLHLYRRVIPLFYDVPRLENWQQEWRNRVHFGTTFALKTGLLRSGAKLVVLSAEEGIGYCNGFQIVTVPFKCDD